MPLCPCLKGKIKSWRYTQMLKSSNPYHVLSETISFDNVQQIGELITLKALRGFLAFSRQSFEKLYIAYVKDLNRLNYPTESRTAFGTS